MFCCIRRVIQNQNNNILWKRIHLSIFFKNKVKSINVETHRSKIMGKGLPKVKPIKGVSKIVLIASGKGGVGKTTTAVNLAAAIKINHPDKTVGLLDADVFGPSVPLMMSLSDTPLVDDDNRMLPLSNYGIKCMSIGFLIAEGSPVIWRGLMVMQALEKLTRGVNWGSIDYLIIDTPPGTGDTQLSLVQNLPINGVILITTPQNAALQVAKRGATMFKTLNVPIIGLVENMSSIDCPACSKTISLFNSTGSKKLANELNAPLLQQIPLDNQITNSCEQGVPVVVKYPNSKQSEDYKNLAHSVTKFLKSQEEKSVS